MRALFFFLLYLYLSNLLLLYNFNKLKKKNFFVNKMTSSLSVIGLVTRLKISSQTTYGSAIYKDKSTNENHAFVIKQFVSAQHEYNEAYKEGDLVLFGGKFTIDQEKLMVNIYRICFKNRFI
jgi:hypothetical protein